jgi:hypothetical protein
MTASRVGVPTTGAEPFEMPDLWRAADTTSVRGQRAFLRLTRAQLALLVAAAGYGAVHTSAGGKLDWVPFAAGAAFVMTAMLRVHLIAARPDRKWYDGRAAAETLKTLAWRYAVGGEPFGIERHTPDEADRLFLERTEEVLQNLRGLTLETDEGSGLQITPSMRELRARPLAERRALYEQHRIEDQRRWYAHKAKMNTRRAGQWNGAMFVLETAGACGAFLKATRVVSIDILGLAGAAVAAGTAWVQAKQHTSLASAYSIAAQELGSVRSLLLLIDEESEWAPFVSQAEDAISREQSSWKASRM